MEIAEVKVGKKRKRYKIRYKAENLERFLRLMDPVTTGEVR